MKMNRKAIEYVFYGFIGLSIIFAIVEFLV